MPPHLHENIERLVGCRVLVPFGPRQLVGVIIATPSKAHAPAIQLREVLELLDQQNLFDEALWQTLMWLSAYYLAPIGEVMSAALPAALRKVSDAAPLAVTRWRLTEAGRIKPAEELKRSPLQLAIIKRCLQTPDSPQTKFDELSAGWRSAVKALVEKGWLVEESAQDFPTHNPNAMIICHPTFTIKEKRTKALIYSG